MIVAVYGILVAVVGTVFVTGAVSVWRVIK